ncbi:MAG: hypothetical protein U5L09_21955 [Bacteroidales bacterium]|nr:hypothetical protein [Bacteroidales bacterium]
MYCVFILIISKVKANKIQNPVEPIAQQAVAEAIIKKHNAATNQRKFNALLATASINNAIEYYRLFKEIQKKKQAANPDYVPLNIACVFSPPAQLMAKNGDQQSQKNAADIKQLQEDLAQEKEDNKQDPEEKKKALMEIIADYNKQYGTNHSIQRI